MSRSDRIVIAVAGGAVVLAMAAVAVLFLPAEEPLPPVVGGPLATLPAESVAVAATTIVIDVEGGVAEPGVRELPAGSRVADAIAAAGGYGQDADLTAAAGLNLAAPLVDGQQIVVPRVGDAGVAAAPPSAPAGGGSAGGLVNLNTATPEELEALPGIGAVTVQKIVAARAERPFSSLEDAVAREVINNGQLEDIRELATAG